MHAVQEQKLHLLEEQEEDAGQAGTEKVLQVLQEAYGS
jgi:hypothetical protein